MTVRFQNLRFN